MEQVNTTTGKTIGSVIGNKILSFIEENSLATIALYIGLIFLAGYLSSCVVNASGTLALTVGLLKWNSWAPLKVLATFALVFNARRIWDATFDWLVSIIELFSGETVTDTIEGIPTVELLDHLFTEKSFKRADIESKFGIPRYKVTELTKRLKEINVLVAGENNASVLNPEYSRQDVATVLRKARTASDLQPLFRQKDERTFTFEPSAGEIEDRVNTLLSPAPAFQKREIAEVA